MKICPICAHANREGFLFCEECGQGLAENPVAIMPTMEMPQADTEVVARATWGTARFSKESAIVLQIRDVIDPVIIEPDKRTVLGRYDVRSQQIPDLDLTPFGALERGVSRVHAAIYRNDDTLVLVDMGSANGTQLNGQRLIPDQPRVLRDGDEIRLGKMVMHIYFRTDGQG
jgi:hypothetical protein